jgi:hypothetical protein
MVNQELIEARGELTEAKASKDAVVTASKDVVVFELHAGARGGHGE